MPDKQVKSKDRVSEHGEVFTAEREVNAMCDLVYVECDRIDSRVLEPACGNGNFLSEILHRKLATVKRLYRRSTYDYERYSVFAVSSLYGVDIMKDNVSECRKRLYEIWNNEYLAVCKKECNDATRNTIKYILNNNILCGNALTLMCVDDDCKDTNIPIIFPEWSMITGTKFKRRDFRLDVLLKANEKPEKNVQTTLFDDEDDIKKYLKRNPVTGDYMALPMRIYKPVTFQEIPYVKREVN